MLLALRLKTFRFHIISQIAHSYSFKVLLVGFLLFLMPFSFFDIFFTELKDQPALNIGWSSGSFLLMTLPITFLRFSALRKILRRTIGTNAFIEIFSIL